MLGDKAFHKKKKTNKNKTTSKTIIFYFFIIILKEIKEVENVSLNDLAFPMPDMI